MHQTVARAPFHITIIKKTEGLGAAPDLCGRARTGECWSVWRDAPAMRVCNRL